MLIAAFNGAFAISGLLFLAFQVRRSRAVRACVCVCGVVRRQLSATRLTYEMLLAAAAVQQVIARSDGALTRQSMFIGYAFLLGLILISSFFIWPDKAYQPSTSSPS
jgi:hypothetical protein